MQLKEILEQSFLKNAVVVAGSEGTINPVTSVTMMDAPDIIDFVKENQLLLTTGYNIKNKPEVLVEIVTKMAECGCAGLALKTHRFLKSIPESVLETAKRLKFPIIELPMEPSLGEIVNEVLKLVLQERTDALEEAMDIHQRFTELIIEGKGLFEVVDQLSKRIVAPVLLLNHRLDLLETSRRFEESFYHDLAYKINEDIKDVELDRGEYRKLVIQFPFEQEKQVATFFPIQMNLYQKGFLIILTDVEEVFPAQKLAIEQAMNVISFELMKLHAVEQQTRMLKNEFLTEFVEGHYTSEKDIAKRGEGYGLREDRTYVCVVCRMDEEEDLFHGIGPTSDEHQLYKDSIYEQLYAWIHHYFEEVVFFTKGDLYIALVGFATSDVEEEWLTKQLKTIQKEMDDYLYLAVSFGIGNPARTLLQIPESYSEAVDAIREGYRHSQKSFVKWTDTRGVIELLRTVTPQRLREFYQSTFKSLASSTRKDDEDLVETLEVYIENNGQIVDTAKALFVHRNTVIYRLKKCEERLHVDLKNAEDIHKLRTAIMVRQMIE